MKLLITGREGQVVRSLLEQADYDRKFDMVALGRPAFDLGDPERVRRVVAAERPDIVVSAAAYTAVDQAEDDTQTAHAVNTVGAGVLAEAAAEANAPVIHLSTDYVFSGNSPERYSENDRPDPQCVYGRTKLAGEEAVAAANPEHVILRTAWVYSPFGKNFVKNMLRLAVDRNEIAVVSDQWGNPTSAFDLADAILRVACKIAGERLSELFGVFHFAGTGDTNWSGLAQKVMVLSADNGGPSAAIRPITTAEFPTRAKRPANSRLCTDKFARVYDWRAPEWQRSTERTVIRLLTSEPASGTLARSPRSRSTSR